jgi:hypothetical protein
MKLDLNTLKATVTSHAAAFRCVTDLQPAGGAGDKVFPATYEGGKYATEKRRIPGEEELVDCVLLELDAAIEQVVPHIIHAHLIDIRTVKEGARGPIIITVEEWQAKIKGSEILVKLVDRKVKLLGLDAPVKSEDVTKIKPHMTEEEIQRGRDLLKRWANFAPRVEGSEAT